MTACFIGLGANLGDPLKHLQNAYDELTQLSQTAVTRLSAIYRSAPIGPGDQGDYLNAVAALDTDLSPLEMLDALQAIEARAGRERTQRWAARTLDLDVLLYGDLTINCERLRVPHVELFKRNFVLVPLAELLPRAWRFPDGSALQDRVKACPVNPLERTNLDWHSDQNSSERQSA